MIVLDSSVLVGIIKAETGTEALIELLEESECVIGTPTLVETRAWCAANLVVRSSRWLDVLVDGEGVAVVPFTRDMADVASDAFASFGRTSGHPSKLNFGDCMAYAVAKVLQAPLLFKGKDFGHTDILMHPASIRT